MLGPEARASCVFCLLYLVVVPLLDVVVKRAAAVVSVAKVIVVTDVFRANVTRKEIWLIYTVRFHKATGKGNRTTYH